MAFGIKHNKKKQQNQQETAEKKVASTKRIKKPGLWIKFKNKIKTYKRVLKITKKPNAKEFKMIVKVTSLGISLIGAIGFLIWIVLTLIMG